MGGLGRGKACEIRGSELATIMAEESLRFACRGFAIAKKEMTKMRMLCGTILAAVAALAVDAGSAAP